MRRKTAKSKSAKSMRTLPAKTLGAKAARGVKGGDKSVAVKKGSSDLPSESLSFNFTKIEYKNTP
ncbi:MAG TPA: hypothetical protein VJA66_08220 [Thermoanaerobaculia bacterium]